MGIHKRFSGELPSVKHLEPAAYHVFVDTESNWSQVDGKTPITRHTLRFGYARFVRWNGSELIQESDIVFKKRKQFWNWLASNKRKDRIWVWAHNIAFDGTLLGLWHVLQEDGCNLIHFTDCDLPAFFQCNMQGRSYQFLDSLNVFKVPLKTIGQQLGIPKMEMPEQSDSFDKWREYCINDVHILHKIVEKWCQFLSLHRLGKMSPSLAGQALTAYRTRFKDHPIHLHCNRSVTELERDSYSGGIVEPKFIGKCPFSPIYEYDVNSLYPYVMKRFKYPNMFCGFERWPSKRRWKELWNKYYLIAHVKINSTTGVFPTRHEGRLMFPLGTYWTTLHKPELERARALGVIDTIGFVAWYTEADLFSSYVDFMFGLRKQYQREGNGVFDFICKLLMNALYGKFGQKRPRWEKYSEELIRSMELKDGLKKGELDLLIEHIDHMESHELRFHHPYNNKLYAARRLLGVNQVLLGEQESPWSFPAISGAVTSYAREYVRNIQEMIGRKNLLYTDTDSFFVNERGKQILERANLIDNEALGKLKSKTVSKSMIIHGPKDYETDSEVKRKGVRAKAKEIEKNVFQQDQWPGFKSLAKLGFPMEVEVKLIEKRLKRELLTLNVSNQGWTYPRLIQLDNYKMY